jgi:tetratricopeptide (TPR) repeat protein
LQPGEVREWKHWWYPIRKLGGVKKATRDAALNLEVTNGMARVALNATKEFKDVHLLLEGAGRTLLNQTISVSPTEPFHTEAAVEAEGAPIRVTLREVDGTELLSYQPAPPKGTPMPTAVEQPKPPRDYATSDELYYTGQRIEQLYSPAFEAQPYYQEILRRDPGDYRANTALGILLCRQWRMQEAAACLSNALDRATANYIRPKEGEAFYYLGVALQAQEQLDEAFEAFSRAAWAQGWAAAADCARAEIECSRGHWEQALELVDRSLLASGHNPKSLGLKLTLLRKLKHLQAAQVLAAEMLTADPLDFRARNELRLIEKRRDLETRSEMASVELTRLMRGEVQSYLQLAVDYARLGCWAEAGDVLDRAMAQQSGRPYPMVYYTRAYSSAHSGDEVEADKWFHRATLASPDLCFPSRYEEVVILREALRRNPQDGRAAYYLGNALYDRQPAEAMRAWEQARAVGSNFALVHRNLAVGYAQHEKDLSKAIASLEKAIELDPNDARFYYELDVQYEAAGASLDQRLKMLSKNREAVEQRDDTTTRLIALLTTAGRGDDAMRFLSERHFHNWEGSGDLHDVYVNACLQRGQSRLNAGKPDLALSDFEAALEYPRNQEVGRGKREARTPEIYYHIGLAKSAMDAPDAAKAAYEKAASGGNRGGSDQPYFKGLALQKLGKRDDAALIFQKLVKEGLADLDRGSEKVDYFAKFGEKRAERVRLAQAQYLVALGELGQGHTEEASARLKKALELNPAHLGALNAKLSSPRSENK